MKWILYDMGNSYEYFSNGPDDVGRWQRATFKFFFRGPLLDWFRQIMLYSHWSTQTWCSTHARLPATDKAVLYTLMTVELAVDFAHSALGW